MTENPLSGVFEILGFNFRFNAKFVTFILLFTLPYRKIL